MNVLATNTYNWARTNEACITTSRLNMLAIIFFRGIIRSNTIIVFVSQTSVRNIILLASQVLQKSLAYDTAEVPSSEH